jgi:hypothetical protein
MVRKNYQPGERSVKDARNRQAGNGSKGKIKSPENNFMNDLLSVMMIR